MESIGNERTMGMPEPESKGDFALRPGEVLGPYRVIRPLGRGGMGEVYFAEHETAYTRHALKIIRPDWVGVRGFEERFFREAKLMSRLQHPNIVRCGDAGVDRGLPWLAMEYIEGPRGEPMDLQVFFDERRRQGKLLAESEAVAVGLQICEALACAHTYRDDEIPAGIVHRDLKPANILLGKETQLYVTDFGLARMIGRDFEQSLIRHSMTSAVSLGGERTVGATPQKTTDRVGTFDYMSPEQREGNEADARSDVYALGAILYELLTGRKVAGVPKRPTKVRPDLRPVWDEIVYERCLAADPEDRFESAADLKDAILAATAEEDDVPAPASAVVAVAAPAAALADVPSRKQGGPSDTATHATPRRSPARRVTAIAAGLALIAGAGLWVFRSTPVALKDNQPGSRGGAAIPRAADVPLAGSTAAPATTATPGVPSAAGGSVIRVPDVMVEDPLVLDLGGGVTMDLCRIPSREFMMGSTTDERDRVAPNERDRKWLRFEGASPQKCAIRDAFWMGRTEVTVRQWKKFIDATGYRTDAEKAGECWSFDRTVGQWKDVRGATWRDPGFGFELTDHHPVCCISWNDAVAFGAWMNGAVRRAGSVPPGYVVRLPTEAEWECACRAGTQTAFWWGDGEDDGEGRLNWAYGDDGFPFLSPSDAFGLRGRNSLGLADMLGNLAEWCQDGFDPSRAHEVPWNAGESTRVVRGGAMDDAPFIARSAFRFGFPPDSRRSTHGFRIVCGPSLEAFTMRPGANSSGITPPPAPPGRGEQVVGLTNSLGMVFVPVPGTETSFCIWETRVRDFEVFVNATGHDATRNAETLAANGWRDRGGSWKSPGFSTTPEHPVCCMSWEDANAFCAWLTAKERAEGRIAQDRSYRLPADWEWSVAVGLDEPKGGATPKELSDRRGGIYPWGAAWPPPAGAGNYGGEEYRAAGIPKRFGVLAGYRDDHPHAAPVGSYAANRFGLHDLGGNVWEWCADRYDGSGDDRALRGASWSYHFTAASNSLMSAFRYNTPSDTRTALHGFRCVLAGGAPAPVADAPAVQSPAPASALPESDSLRLGLYLHYGLQTFTGPVVRRESPPKPRSFAPTGLDARGWARLARECGMQFAVLTVKHETGFCLWDADDHTYDVAASAATNDIVAAFLDACRAEGILPGVHYSIPDRHNEGGVEFKAAVADSYFNLIRRQTEELHRKYPAIRIHIFDVASRLSDAQYATLRDSIRGLNPGCMAVPGSVSSPTATKTRPGEWHSDTVNSGWMWSPSAKIAPVSRILESYRNARAAGLPFVLNVGVDRTGAVPADIAASLREAARALVPEAPAAALAVPRRPAPTRMVAPFNADEAALFQAAWARYLDVPVRMTNAIGMAFVLIPPGEFQMGSPEGEDVRRKDEVRHKVILSRPFRMSVHPVTVGQFAGFVNGTGYRTEAEIEGQSWGVRVTDGRIDGDARGRVRSDLKVDGMNWRNPGFPQDADHPVTQVSWNDAQAFCTWLSQRCGMAADLPTEAQWEFATRAGTTAAWPWGSDPGGGAGMANGADVSLKKVLPPDGGGITCFDWDDGYPFTSPVGRFGANAFGLHDAIGNVAHWCRDQYVEYSAGTVTDPVGATGEGSRIIRGGSWNNFHPLNCRSAARYKFAADFRNERYGFRVVLDPSVGGATGGTM